MTIEEVLSPSGLKFEDLNAIERETLFSWLKVLENNQLTLDSVKEYVFSLKGGIENELSYKRETPQNFLSLASFFIPFIGIVRKWYADQEKLYLEARLKNLLLLEAFLTSPEKARKQLEHAVAGIASNKGVSNA